MSIPAPKDTRFLCSTGIMLSPPLALAFEISGALILQQLHYWLAVSKHKHEGFTWVYNTYDQWVAHLHVYSDKTIRNKLKELEDLGIVLTGNFNKTSYDRTKWYRLDYEKLVLVVREKLPNWRVFPQPSGSGYQMVLEAATGPIPKNTQREQQRETMVKPSTSRAKATPLKVIIPSGTAIEQPNTSTAKETTMPKEPNSSVAILAALKEKKGLPTRAAQVPNCSASLQHIWKTMVAEHHPHGGMVPMFTMAQKGQFSQIARKLGNQSDAVVGFCVQEWIGFTKYVAGAAGLHKTPDLPQVGFMLKYAGEGSAYRAQSNPSNGQEKASTGKKTEVEKPVQLIAQAKPLAKLSPVKSPAPKPKASATVEAKEDAASVDEILAWKPKDKP